MSQAVHAPEEEEEPAPVEEDKGIWERILISSLNQAHPVSPSLKNCICLTLRPLKGGRFLYGSVFFG